MKSLITFSLALATLLICAHFTNGQSPDIALILACVFAAGLIAWTNRQYERKYFPLTRARPLRLPVRAARQAPPRRLAA